MSKTKINILINGELHSFEGSQSIESVLNTLNLNKNNIAIEINREIISKSKYKTHTISNNDKMLNVIGKFENKELGDGEFH